jgi:protein-S-isoprenylcysteine O-methyltransferase Ste14
MDKQSILKAGSLAGLALAIAGLLYLVRNNFIVSTNPVGLAMQGLAIALMIWARFTFGMRSFHAVANTTEGGLVTHGAYRWFRHPIYAAILYFVWGAVLSSYRFPYAIAAASLVSAGLIARLLIEESFLRVAYAQYEAYSKQTKRIVPFLF